MIEHYSNNIQNIIQRELFNSRVSIKVVVAWFTNNLLFQPLLLKLMSGVSVELILNKDDINLSSENEIDFDLFVQHGGRIHWNTTPKLMHDKFCIIDDNIVISGSYNWTNKAEYNEESITLFRDEEMTLSFYNDLFEKLSLRYPTFSTQHCHGLTNARNTSCPLKQPPYTKLNFYDSIRICYGYEYPNNIVNVNVFANEIGSGLFALLDNETFLPQTEYMFSVIPHQISYYHSKGINYMWVKGETSWGLFDCNNLLFVVLPQFESVTRCDKDNDYYIVCKGGKCGAYNIDGKILLNCDFDELEYLDDGVFRTKMDNLFGLFYTRGGITTFISCQYNEVKSLDSKYCVLKKGDKYAVAFEGQLVSAPLFDDYIHEYKNYGIEGRIIVKRNGKYGLFDRGKLVINCDYDDLKIGKPMCFNGMYGMFSSDGCKVLDFIYDKIELIHKDYYCVTKDGKYGVFDVEAKRIRSWYYTKDEAFRDVELLTSTPNLTYWKPIKW